MMTVTAVTKQCPFTGVTNTLELPIAPDVYLDCFMKWQSGALIQEAFPMLTPDYREFIMTGITPFMWDAMPFMWDAMSSSGAMFATDGEVE